MAKAASQRDVYSNKAYGSVTESAANTLTFSEISTNVNVFDKMAWIVNRMEWYCPPGTLNLLVGAGDALQIALTSSQNLSALGLDNPGVIDMFQLSYYTVGGANAKIWNMPFIRDFSTLPGGGIIIAPRPLYVAIVGTSLATPASAEMRMSFQQKVLSADEYLEMVDFYRIVG